MDDKWPTEEELRKVVRMMSMSVIVLAALLFAASPTYANAQPNTESEEAQRLIEFAEAQFIGCKPTKNSEFSEVQFYNDQECDHNILFLKGVCEYTNNSYDYCYDTNMVRYLNDKNINNAPRPPDAWCDMFIDKCISKFEAYKTSTLEILGSDTDVDFLDDIIEQLEDKKAAQEQEDNENENEN